MWKRASLTDTPREFSAHSGSGAQSQDGEWSCGLLARVPPGLVRRGSKKLMSASDADSAWRSVQRKLKPFKQMFGLKEQLWVRMTLSSTELLSSSVSSLFWSVLAFPPPSTAVLGVLDQNSDPQFKGRNGGTQEQSAQKWSICYLYTEFTTFLGHKSKIPFCSNMKVKHNKLTWVTSKAQTPTAAGILIYFPSAPLILWALNDCTPSIPWCMSVFPTF